ncbi:PaaI family thioesterase [Quisquiliibacterium transsilvanicum]|uniref:Uncharacterized protein (TIGR00369 family) n=1 Tax=Quisquiliibacterium transsilvanicum TaxID=1549638 RepID=A0A7W8HM83_9BURK|nr:PaaI family thioesterase [Quisquiliibacterium transsilvanicum]MBB5273683.1 uncharacterized protein (TIGR00369 family) [Quisquiliibacterium transsilvanicum]
MTTIQPSPRQQILLEFALHRHLGLAFEASADGKASAGFVVDLQHIAFGGLHGGVLYALMDAVAMLALLTRLAPDRHAVTHDLHVSVMRGAAFGDRVVLAAQVARLGRSLAFVDVAARVGETMIATARVTKSVVVPKPA